jgi:hypothetical protein
MRRDAPQFTDIPVEIILKVFEVFKSDNDPVAAACLGLTKKSMYLIFKAFFPDPVELRHHAMSTTGDLLWNDLGNLLLKDGQILPKHRLGRGLFKVVFLNVDVYGDGLTENENAIRFMERFEAYHDSECYYLTGFEGMATGKPLLPSPFGIGDQWYCLAVEAWDKFITHDGWKDMHEQQRRDNLEHWISWWRNMSWVKELRNYEAWLELGEWIDLVGF